MKSGFTQHWLGIGGTTIVALYLMSRKGTIDCPCVPNERTSGPKKGMGKRTLARMRTASSVFSARTNAIRAQFAYLLHSSPPLNGGTYRASRRQYPLLSSARARRARWHFKIARQAMFILRTRRIFKRIFREREGGERGEAQ